jgi:cytochrome c peroxidase
MKKAKKLNKSFDYLREFSKEFVRQATKQKDLTYDKIKHSMSTFMNKYLN